MLQPNFKTKLELQQNFGRGMSSTPNVLHCHQSVIRDLFVITCTIQKWDWLHSSRGFKRCFFHLKPKHCNNIISKLIQSFLAYSCAKKKCNSREHENRTVPTLPLPQLLYGQPVLRNGSVNII